MIGVGFDNGALRNTDTLFIEEVDLDICFYLLPAKTLRLGLDSSCQHTRVKSQCGIFPKHFRSNSVNANLSIFMDVTS